MQGKKKQGPFFWVVEVKSFGVKEVEPRGRKMNHDDPAALEVAFIGKGWEDEKVRGKNKKMKLWIAAGGGGLGESSIKGSRKISKTKKRGGNHS